MRSNQALTLAVIVFSLTAIAHLLATPAPAPPKEEPKPTMTGITPVMEDTKAPKGPVVSLSLPNGPRPTKTEGEKVMDNSITPFPTTDFMVSSRSVPTIRQFADEFVKMLERFRIHDPDSGFVEPEWMSHAKREKRVSCAIDELEGITNNSKMNLIYDCVKNANTLEEYKDCYQYIYE